MSLTLEEILAHSARKTKAVEAFGGQVLVRSLSCGESLELQRKAKEAQETLGTENSDTAGIDLMAFQLAMFMSDATGKRLLSDEQARKIVSDSDHADVLKVIRAGTDFSSWTKEAEEEARGN